MLSDDELLDFDGSRYAHYDESEARRRLAEFGDVFRAQLVAARWIEGWRQRMGDADSPTTTFSPEWWSGHDQALGDIIAHLRQGDLAPDGVLYREEVGNLPRPGS